MEIINILKNDKYLDEYIRLCYETWGKKDKEINTYIKEKRERILKEDKIISIIGLIDNNIMLGFISLFKYDGIEKHDLTPWYATMYVKKEYRNNGYSKILNEAILKEAKRLGYNRVYLKTDLVNYYEKFNAKYIENLSNKEKLYYIDI